VKTTPSFSAYYPFILFICISPLTIDALMSGILFHVGRNSMWFAMPVVSILLAGLYCTQRVCVQRGAASLLQVCEDSLRPWMLKIVYLLLGLALLETVIWYNISSADFISKTLMYGSEKSPLCLFLIITVTMSLLPIESHARYAHLMMLVSAPIYVIISLIGFRNIHWNYVLPSYSMQELQRIDIAAANLLFMFSPLAAIPLINAGDKQQMRISFHAAAVIVLVCASYECYMQMLGIGIFGIHTAQKFVHLSQYIINSVRVENFIIDRMIFFGILLWTLTFVGTVPFLLRMGLFALCKTIGIRFSKITLLVGGVLVSGLILLTGSRITVQKGVVLFGYTDLLVIVIIPMCLYLTTLRKGNRQ